MRGNTVRRLALTAIGGALAAKLSDLSARRAESDNPPSGRLIDIGAVRLHAQVRGTGDPILILHGNGAMVQEVEATGLPAMLEQDHRVIVVDRPGFGHSTRPGDTRWTPERQARLISMLLEREAPAPVTIVAHSWGTLVALALAIGYPERVRGLVLISGYYYPVPRADVVLGILNTPLAGDVLRHTLAPVAGRVMAQAIIDRIFEPNDPTQSFQEQYPISMALRPSQLRALGEENALMQSSADRLSRQYGEISCPVAILGGADDRIVDTQLHSVRLARDIPNADLHVVDGIGHMLPHIAPEVVKNAINRVEATSGVDQSAASREQTAGGRTAVDDQPTSSVEMLKKP